MPMMVYIQQTATSAKSDVNELAIPPQVEPELLLGLAGFDDLQMLGHTLQMAASAHAVVARVTLVLLIRVIHESAISRKMSSNDFVSRH